MEILFLIIGLAVGGIITYAIMRIYFNRDRKQLFKKVTELQDLNYRMLWKMEEAGLIRWNRNGRGHIIGLEINIKSDAESTEGEVKDRTLH
jgi:hypothetical protein